VKAAALNVSKGLATSLNPSIAISGVPSSSFSGGQTTNADLSTTNSILAQMLTVLINQQQGNTNNNTTNINGVASFKSLHGALQSISGHEYEDALRGHI
jgi:hypothetical protein